MTVMSQGVRLLCRLTHNETFVFQISPRNISAMKFCAGSKTCELWELKKDLSILRMILIRIDVPKVRGASRHPRNLNHHKRSGLLWPRLGQSFGFLSKNQRSLRYIGPDNWINSRRGKIKKKFGRNEVVRVPECTFVLRQEPFWWRRSLMSTTFSS